MKSWQIQMEDQSMDEEIQIFVPECADDDVSELLRNLTKCLAELSPSSISHGCLGGEFGYGCAFENDTFLMFPYYWGDCACGCDEREEEWANAHGHTGACYRTGYAAIKFDWLDEKEQHTAAVKALCEARGIPYNEGIGSAIHCDCGHQQAWQAFAKTNPHLPDCPIIRPNFLHKPSGVTVDWYKYIGRDMEIKAPDGFDWEAAIHECLCSARDASVKPDRSAE